MTIYRFGPFQLDAARLILLLDGGALALGPKVVETLLALIEHPGDVLSKSDLLDRIWPEGFVEESNLAQNIYVLRKTLRAHWKTDAILTLPRRGYRFNAQVEVEQAALHVPTKRAARSAITRRWPIAAAAAFALLLGGAAFSQARPTHSALTPQGAQKYALGRYYWNLRTKSSLQKSVADFSQVTKSDPQDARGYAALADAHAMNGDYHYGKPVQEFAQAKRYAARALQLDPNSAEANAVLGIIALDTHRGDAQAQVYFRHAIALDQSFAPAHQWYGTTALMHGNTALAMRELQIAANLEPVSAATFSWLGETAYFERRFNDALAYERQALDLSPNRPDALVTMGAAYEQLGQYQRAVDSYRAFAAACGCRAAAAAMLAHTYAEMHRLPEARAQLAIARKGAGESVSFNDLAYASIAVGERNVALHWLKKASLDDPKLHALLALDPRMDPVRDDPRFKLFMQGPA
ncbi:MAG: winged helix-turn-helix domain-containing protein [Candidatus Eremiobacteraeota bacterium]|nr:winged helix-turn-helix domain-containing protein [Candidatus Eremiobacteraeota bacterium]